jgi:hypothetical protein
MHSHATATVTGVHGVETTGPSHGAVVLDIGGDLGALVVRTSSELEACEIEIRRLRSAWDGTHVAVRSRPCGGSAIFAAVFASLRQGEYELRLRPLAIDGAVQRIEVTGGTVTETTWPAPHTAA